MTAESNVGARIFLIGKDAALAGLKEVQAAVAKLNAQIADGAAASRTAAAGEDVQAASMARMNLAMDTYKANLAETTAATDAFARVGKVAFYAIAGAAAAWGYESIKWAQQYQTALVQLHTQAGLTASAVRSIGAAAMTNAAGLGITPTAYLQAIYHPASAGFSVKASEAITSNAAKLSAIGGPLSPVETTVNAITGVMRSYNYKANQAEHVTALTNAIIGAGNMHAGTLNAALASGVAASAKTFGVSYQSLGSALAFMTDRGVPASQAGTHLRMTMSLLGAPSQMAGTLLRIAGMTTSKILSSTNSLSQMLQATGVRSSQLAHALRTNKGKGGIYNALEVLHQGLTTRAHLTKQMQGAMISRTFGGGKMGTTIEMMYNSLGTLGKKATKIGKTGTNARFMSDWTKETGTLDFQLRRLDSTVHTLGTSFGSAIIGPLTKVIKLFISLITWTRKNKAVAYELGGMVLAVLVPAIGVYLYRALFKSGGAIKTVLEGYSNLLRGNNVEQLALKKTAEQLTLTTEETDRLAAATSRAGGAARTTAGRIAFETGIEDKNAAAASTDAAATSRLGAAETAAGRAATSAGGGGASGLAGKAMGAAGLAFTGVMAGTMIRNGQSTTVHRGQTLKQAAQTEFGDAAAGAGIGAALGNLIPIPGVGAGIGAAVGAGAGLLWGVHHQIASDASGLWHNLFGGGNQSTSQRPVQVQSHVHVYLNGQEVKKAVTKATKRDAALAGG